MKKIITVMAATFVLFTSFMGSAQAGKNQYVYRDRADWVKVVKLSAKQLGGVTLHHPVSNITPDQLTGMLSNITMNKKKVFKKELQVSEVFSPEEARKFAPLILEALRKAGPNQVVNVSLVHKRPMFVVRQDYLSMMNVYQTEQGLHFYFTKLFAKLDGDYEQASNLDQAIRKARGIRVGLEAGEGQILLADGNELVFDTNRSYEGSVPAFAETAPAKQQSAKKIKTAEASLQPELAAPSSQTMQGRLETLENLKQAKLISKKEYEAKRAQILSEL
ncbi:MAG: hypothetical protein H7A33_03695 [Deltaproteobacteria bacterium]|nr:hypothetical protein [Deltaproteobacteria bacterium]